MNSSASILKEEKYKIDLEKGARIDKLIDIEYVSRHDWTSPLEIRGLKSTMLGRKIFLSTQTFNRLRIVTLMREASQASSVLNKYKDILQNVLEGNDVAIHDIKDIFKYAYLDLYIYLELAAYFAKDSLKSDFYKRKIRQIIPGVDFVHKTGSKISTEERKKKSDLLTASLTSSVWSQNKSTIKTLSLCSILESINAVEVEIPYRYDSLRLHEALTEFNYLLSYFDIKNRNFVLRFKKLGLYKKEGLYIKQANTIVIDPRHVTSLYHELGHFIYEEGIPFTIEGKRIYAREFNKIVKKQKERFLPSLIISKIESHNVDSEIFAHWFDFLCNKYTKKN